MKSLDKYLHRLHLSTLKFEMWEMMTRTWQATDWKWQTALFPDIDEKLDKRDLHLVKISDAGAGEEYGIQDLPSLVYFENGVPEIFEGDIRNDNQIIKWMLDELKQEEIKDVTVAMLNRLIDRNHNLAVVFMDEESKEGNIYDQG